MPHVVTEYVFQLIARQVDDNRLVVWYDPERAYSEAIAEWQIPDATIVQFDGSFLQLRHDIDPLLDGEEPPRLLVYVPEDQAETHHALAELEAGGVVMQSGQQPPQGNTKLSIVARNALKTLLGEQPAHDVEKPVEAGKLTLADLNALAKKGGEIAAVVALIFGTGSPQEVALAFLGSGKYDAEIGKKAAQGELAGLLGASFDVELLAMATLDDLRAKLARHVLLTDLVEGLGKSVPPSLASVPIASTPSGLDSCVRLAKTWRQLRDYRESYVAAATQVEQELGLALIEFPAEKITQLETFLALELALLRHVETELQTSATPELLALAQSRLSRFWSDCRPTIQAHWALIVAAAEVLLEADRVAKELKKPPAAVPAFVKSYTDGDTPWCLLDTHHRHSESRWHNFDPIAGHDGLEKLVVKARQRYMEVGGEMAKQFVTLVSKAKYPIEGIARQADVFGSQVKPRMEEKTAYLWVDALRFEMARELCEVLRGDFQIEIGPALGAIPTITEIGMAALLPKASDGKLVSVGGGKLGLEIHGRVIKDRKDRIAFLKDHAGAAVFDAKLEDLLPKPSKKVRQGIENARLVLITSQEIDELCEQDNIAQARRQMDGVLVDLRRGVRVLADLGVKSIVLTADHGHLFTDEIGEEMKIEAPGGETADLHRRVWVGVGGTQEPCFFRTSLESLGVESELDIATPWDFACFKAKGGARAYFHGGLSPQELIIPVVSLVPAARNVSGPPAGVQWTVTPGTPKLTTRFFSVQIAGKQGGLFDLEAPKVRVEIQAKGKCVSRPVSASYGFEDATGEVELRGVAGNSKELEPNTVALMLIEEIAQKTVSVVLLDASSGAELAVLDKIEVAIAF